MKSYKLVNSKEVQEKAFRLGYKWYFNKGTRVVDLDKYLIHLNGKDMDIVTLTVESFNRHKDIEEITQADFLAIPEPTKVGDWIKFESNDRVVVFKVAVLNNENEAFWLDATIDDRYFNLDYCAKLTPEQIKVLGLEK